MQAIVAVPEPVILLGVIDPHVSPVGIVSVREITPPNPLRAVRVAVVVPLDPVSTVTGVVELME